MAEPVSYVFAGLLALLVLFVAAKAIRAKGARAADVAFAAGPARLLVPCVQEEFSFRAVELAARLARDRKARIVLTYIIEVPRNMPLGTPMLEDEQRAVASLAHPEQFLTSQCLKPETRVERSRQAGEGIVKVAKELGAEMIVMGMPSAHGSAEALLGETIEAVVSRAPCEVVVVRAAPSAG
ncbi:MAG TPA: universal stress protein [Armatimonadota bacterium]|jgi:nucleotide-binding universal stress UspA family protein